MGKSKALRKREKRVREGSLDPEKLRSSFAKLDLRTRTTKTKKNYLYRTKHKSRNPQTWDSDFFIHEIHTIWKY